MNPAWILRSVGLTLGSAALAVAASPTGNAILAAVKVAEQPNYSWTMVTSNDDARTSTVLVGKAEKGGFALISDKTPSSYLRLRLGRSVGTTLELAARGGRIAIQGPEGWLFPAEVPEPPTPARGGRSGRGSGRAGLPGGTAPLNFSLRLPTDDLEIIIGSATDLRPDRDGFSGELSPIGAAQFLHSFGQPQPEVRRASATFQCWVQDGIVIKYEVRVNARVSFPNGRSDLPVRWTITTEIQNIGKTKVEVPAQVRAKFGR